LEQNTLEQDTSLIEPTLTLEVSPVDFIPVEIHWAEADRPTYPPTNLYSDEPPLETDLHRQHIDLLIRLLQYWWRDRNDFYISGNLTVYYSASQTKKRDFRGPDIFIVLDVEKRDRRSWTIWEEDGKYPNVVIELLSSSTAEVDRTTKKTLYQNVWRLPEYFWFDPYSLEFMGFRLSEGQYEEIVANDQGRLRSAELDLELGIHQNKLRWFSADGTLIPLPEEIERQARLQAEQLVDQERQAKEQERQAKEQERQAKERLEAYLRSQGIDPNQLPVD
jgi:Uma2 family endonuclease